MNTIDWLQVDAEVELGYIARQRHEAADLHIYNYTAKAQYDWRWNEATMACRGLIADGRRRIVARPFPKFFSYDQLQGIIPAESFQVFDKLDGSLGILYFVDDEPWIATRGSFTSPQAVWATNLYRRKYRDVTVDRRLTYLFEIIYPENRIVVDYGDTADLFLLATIETETGYERPLEEIGFPVVPRFDGIRDFDQILAWEDDGREGFVVRFEGGTRVKFKFEEYKRLHKLLTEVSPRTIWEVLRATDSIESILEDVPDEFYGWVREIESELRRRFESVHRNALGQLALIPENCDRRTFAEHAKKCDDPWLVFAIKDGRPYREVLWRRLRPSGRNTFRLDSDR